MQPRFGPMPLHPGVIHGQHEPRERQTGPELGQLLHRLGEAGVQHLQVASLTENTGQPLQLVRELAGRRPFDDPPVGLQGAAHPSGRHPHLVHRIGQVLPDRRISPHDGIGLFPHEGPHLNPQWDDTFEVGDVFTAEPGLYAPDLRGGIRLENDYLVTATGVELLSDFPLEL